MPLNISICVLSMPNKFILVVNYRRFVPFDVTLNVFLRSLILSLYHQIMQFAKNYKTQFIQKLNWDTHSCSSFILRKALYIVLSVYAAQPKTFSNSFMRFKGNVFDSESRFASEKTIYTTYPFFMNLLGPARSIT